MRFAISGFLLTAMACAAMAQAPEAGPAMKLFSSSADVAALVAQAKSEHKDQALIAKPILKLAPYQASMEYRAAVGPAALHKKDAEFFYVIDGSGTMMTGGKLVNEKNPNPDNANGTAIEGGMSRAVAKGDFIVVPENTPHWFSKINGVLVLMSLHVPRTEAAN